jgi:hypothetical protein
MKIKISDLRSMIRVLLEASRSAPAQADSDDPYGKYLFAKKRKDLKGTPAAAEKDTPEEAELYQAFNDHYNNREYSLGDVAPQLLDLVKQGKYAKLLAPPPGPYYRIISDVDITTLCKILGIDRKSVVYGKPTRTKGGVMTPGGTMAGTTGIHSWTTALDPSWVKEDLHVSSSLASRLLGGPAAMIVLKASGGKNFFANPVGMQNVVGLGKYVERQDEVISYGPVKFSSAAYFAAKKIEDFATTFDIGELIAAV